MLKNFLLLLPVFLLAGCATAVFTRLTPNVQPRNANNLYAVETAFDTQQQSLRPESIKAFAIVDGHSFPLRAVPIVEGRWEGLISVPPTVSAVTYRFKFDYLYNNFGTAPKPNSVSSKPFVLKIVD